MNHYVLLIKFKILEINKSKKTVMLHQIEVELYIY